MIDRTEADIMKKWGDYSTPLVTIRCMTYNHEKYIADALDGFLMQETDFPFEILVHDDASTDGTADIIREYERKYPHIMKPVYETENQYSKHDGSLGRIVNGLTRGKYIATCEGDDFWTSPNKLQLQIDYMLNNPDCSMCFHAVNYYNNGTVVNNDLITKEECDLTVEQIIEGGGNFCATASLCYKTEHSLIKPKYRLMSDVGDYPLQIMLATLGRVHYFPQIMGCYRVGNANSWIGKTLHSEKKDKEIKHWYIEIAWLNEFNLETEYKYNDSVLMRVFVYYIILYTLGEKTAFREACKTAKNFKSKNKRIEHTIRLYKIWIHTYIPWISKMRHALKNNLFMSERGNCDE